MSSTTRTLSMSLAIMAIVALLAACTSGGGATAAPSVAAPSVAAPSVAAPSVAPSAAAGDATIALSESDLGTILVDAEGMTLYAFTPDTAGESTCYDDCAAAWPPLLVDDPAAAAVGDGLDASLLSTVDRTDGTKQVKYGDWPLYYFANDSAAGDVNGQGVGEKWYVVDAAGALIGQ
jgi:predicted lipoprotein with Yx(FWY)xxD motif